MYHLSGEALSLLMWCESVVSPYHLRVIDRGQAEVTERDEEAFQLSNQQQQNHTISKLNRGHKTGGDVIWEGATTDSVGAFFCYLFVHISHLQTHSWHILVDKV